MKVLLGEARISKSGVGDEVICDRVVKEAVHSSPRAISSATDGVGDNNIKVSQEKVTTFTSTISYIYTNYISRQVAEAIFIQMQDHILLNIQGGWNVGSIPRLVRED